jgi:hypothetical protein
MRLSGLVWVGMLFIGHSLLHAVNTEDEVA